MSNVFVAAIIVGVVVTFYLVLMAIANEQNRKRMNLLLHRFSKAGSRYHLSFSGQEVLKGVVVGLDGVQRKMLLMYRLEDSGYHDEVIDLYKVKSCSLKKQYGTIQVGGLKEKGLDHYLQRLVLHVDFSEGREPLEIPFYTHTENNIHELPELEQKARHWEALLSKMLHPPLKKIA